MDDNGTYDQVVAQAGCDLGECVCGARSDDDNVCPSPQFDMEDGIADGVCPLCKHEMTETPVILGGKPAYQPFIVVRPDARTGVFDVCGVEEREGLFR